LGKADAALARIMRLLDLNQKKGSPEDKFNLSTLELAAYALEMFFCEEKTEALEILDGVRDKLLTSSDAMFRHTENKPPAIASAADSIQGFHRWCLP
jgi:hypothetical protein